MKTYKRIPLSRGTVLGLGLLGLGLLGLVACKAADSSESASGSAPAPAPASEPMAAAPAPASEPMAAAPAASTEAAAAPAPAPAQPIEVAQLKADLDGGQVPLLIDVRTPDEFKGGHVPGARNIPLDTLEAHLGELAEYQQKPVYVICERGRRSAQAASLLAGKGFQPRDVAGGTQAWRGAGYPVE